MKPMSYLFYNALPIACIVAATVLICVRGPESNGWGWLILLAFVSAVGPTGRGD